eukprot:SAG31_NODE_4208_length_3473_cov_2.441612_5_plen_83_part_00
MTEATELSGEHTGSYEWEEAGQYLLEFAVSEVKSRMAARGGDDSCPCRVLELGCGCGAVGMRLAAAVGAAVTLTDLPSFVVS